MRDAPPHVSVPKLLQKRRCPLAKDVPGPLAAFTLFASRKQNRGLLRQNWAAGVGWQAKSDAPASELGRGSVRRPAMH